MVVAQALGEYGVGALVGSVSSGILNIIADVTSLEPTQYAILIGAAVVLWMVFSRR